VPPTALAKIPALVTSDADLLDIDESNLAAEFDAADLPPVLVCHPKRLLKAMAPKGSFSEYSRDELELAEERKKWFLICPGQQPLR